MKERDELKARAKALAIQDKNNGSAVSEAQKFAWIEFKRKTNRVNNQKKYDEKGISLKK